VSTGTIIGSGGEVGLMSGRKSSTTNLALMAAPPDKKGYALAALAAVVTGVIAFPLAYRFFKDNVAPAVALGIIGVIVVVMSIDPRQWNKNEYPKLLHEWKQKFMCRRCGETFIPAAQAPAGQRFR
jgi:hypothetical protein